MADLPVAPTGPAETAGAQGFCAPAARKFILISAILASAMAFIDGSVLALALPSLRADLGLGLGAAQWVANGYALALSAFLLVGGAAGDRFGTKRVFVWGIAGFVVTSIWCALATNGAMLIVARLAQGLAAAFMVPGSLAVISRAFPDAERGKAIGTWASVSAISTAIGPIAGGALLAAAPDWAWRAIFAINVPIGAFVLYLLLVRVDGDTEPETKPIDWLGAAYATLALGLIAFGLTVGEGGSGTIGFSLRDGLFVGAGAAVLVLFLMLEGRTENPLVPLGIFRNRAFAAANIVTSLVYFSLSAILFYLPMTLIAGWGVSESVIGLLFAPFAFAIGGLSRISGSWADRFGAEKLVAAGSLVFALACLGLTVLLPTQNIWGVVLPLIVLLGMGMGLLIAPLSSAIMASVGPRRSGLASGVNNAISRVAGMIAVAAMGRLAAIVFYAELPEEARDSLSFGLPTEGSLFSVQNAASTSAFIAIAVFCAALTLLAGLIAVFGMRTER